MILILSLGADLPSRVISVPMPLELEERIKARRRVYLLRHGDVSYFDEDGRPFPPEGVPLNATGVAQAEALARALESTPIDRAVSSGLPRTVQTAEIVTARRGIAVETCRDLREIAPGKLNELRRADRTGDAAASFERVFTGALGEDITGASRFLGGETFGDFQARVLPAFDSILRAGDWKQLLVVAHGGTNRVILLHALGASLSSMGRLEQDAGCLNVIDVTAGGHPIVRLVNYTAHQPLKKGIHMTTMEKIFLEYQEKIEKLIERGGER